MESGEMLFVTARGKRFLCLPSGGMNDEGRVRSVPPRETRNLATARRLGTVRRVMED